EPHAARFLRRLGTFCRFTHFDKRGTGMSDRPGVIPSLEDRAADLTAVMDAEQIDSAVLAGFSEGGLVAAYYAATHPERVRGLILHGTAACFTRRDDLPWNPTAEEWRALIELWSDRWGTGTFTVPALCPSKHGDAAFLEWMSRYERQSLSPGAVVPLQVTNGELDIRHLLPSIRVPTLVLYRDKDP